MDEAKQASSTPEQAEGRRLESSITLRAQIVRAQIVCANRLAIVTNRHAPKLRRIIRGNALKKPQRSATSKPSGERSAISKPRRGELCQPRATPWVNVTPAREALKGRPKSLVLITRSIFQPHPGPVSDHLCPLFSPPSSPLNQRKINDWTKQESAGV